MSCRPSLLESGDVTIAWIAAHLRSPWLTPIMEKISDLGQLGPIIVMMSLAYWCWNKRASRTIWYGIFLSLLMNIWIKGMVMECRPPSVFRLEDISELSFSFPSGHTQVTILIWCGLAYYVREKWLATFYVCIGLLIGFSRAYLGVHYVHDVMVGLLLGLTILSLCILNDKKNLLKLQNLPLWAQSLWVLGFLTVCQLLINNQTGHLAIATGGLFGFWLGSKLEDKYLRFTPNIGWRYVLFVSTIGFGGLYLLQQLPGQIAMGSSLKFALQGLWVAYGTPALTLFPKMAHRAR